MEARKRTILYLMEYPIDLPGGGQESTKTLCEGLVKDSRFAPVVACPSLLTHDISDYPFKIVCYPSDENRELSKIRRIKNFLLRIAHFKRIIREVSPDLIHVSMSESLITFGALRVPGSFKNIPFVYTDRGLRFGYRKHSLICIKATMKRAARMLTTTRYNASLWDDLSVPVTVIPNTISSAFNDYDPKKRSLMRGKYDVDDDVTVIGFAGRISEEKNWEKVPDVVRAISEAGIKIKVALVLSVYESTDEKTAENIRSGIAGIVGKENLIYMQDLDQKEISAYYYLVDFFIMTSSFESFGKAAVEAMSRKCVVLSTAVGGLPEVIGKKDDLYDMEDLGRLTDRIRQLLDDEDAMERERQMFYERYKDNYTEDKNIEGHIKVYEEILGR
ncbi:MAG: glycosyltransferase family 4 protein [Lachnospiraceae bacterium]|nr:glycosyltransferase family 4 protein [Lachnospiraceae bacterium]